MIHRLAIIIGSVAAAAILALGFLATGLGPRAATADAEQPAATTSDTAAVAPERAEAPSTPKPITRVETTTVYVRPAPKPKVIHVSRRAPAPARHHTRTVPRVPPTHRRGDDGGGERGDD